jgi:uncharacterized Ntn-hydrolase superfamily protein
MNASSICSGSNVLELNTFSIVARCERSGALGVAVASAVPAVGAMCPYLIPGVGAVSTQSWVNPYLAIDALHAMQSGASASAALEHVLAADGDAALRQIGVIGATGSGVAWTGSQCTPWKGHLTGVDFAIQGNMLTGRATLDAMQDAWRATSADDFAERLLQVLEAGDQAGGDFRGKQSVAVKIVDKEAYARVDLRVDDHVQPIIELRRLFELARKQLFPFIEGMNKRYGPQVGLSDDVTGLLLRSPSNRVD